jgi:hypothetical protein
MRGDIPGPLCRHTLTTLPGQSLKQMILIGGSKNDGGTNKEIRILHTGIKLLFSIYISIHHIL